MSPLLRVFLQIALRMRGPDALPVSRFLLMVTLVGYLFAGVAVLLLWDISWDARIGLLVMSPLFLVGFTYAVLRLERKHERATQTLTALFALSILFTLLNGAVQLVLPDVLAAREALALDASSAMVDFALITLQVVVLVLLVWNIAAFGWVYQRALDKDAVYGTGVAVLYYFVDLILTQSMVA